MPAQERPAPTRTSCAVFNATVPNEECDGRLSSSSSQVPMAMRSKRRFRKELNLDRLAVQCSAESCHVMTSTSEKPINGEVDEIAQW